MTVYEASVTMTSGVNIGLRVPLILLGVGGVVLALTAKRRIGGKAALLGAVGTGVLALDEILAIVLIAAPPHMDPGSVFTLATVLSVVDDVLIAAAIALLAAAFYVRRPGEQTSPAGTAPNPSTYGGYQPPGYPPPGQPSPQYQPPAWPQQGTAQPQAAQPQPAQPPVGQQFPPQPAPQQPFPQQPYPAQATAFPQGQAYPPPPQQQAAQPQAAQPAQPPYPGGFAPPPGAAPTPQSAPPYPAPPEPHQPFNPPSSAPPA